MNKILLFSLIAAIIVVGSIGMYLSTLLENNLPQETATTQQNIPKNVQIKTTVKAPEQFPYKFDKDIFSDSEYQKIEYSSNNPIKFESQEDIVKFLSESLKIQQSQTYYPQYTLEETLQLQRRTGSAPVPEPEPRPESPPSLREGRQEIPADGTTTSFEFSANPTSFGDSNTASLDDTGVISKEYSTTNVQVRNVDEPDYLKTDGKYIYVGTQNTIAIIDAYPPESAKVLMKFALDIEPQSIENIFLNGNSLVVMYYATSESQAIDEFDFRPYPVYNTKTAISVIDVSDKSNPKIISKHEVDGSYSNSRMIGDTVYVISTNYVDYSNPIIPRIMSESGIINPDVYRFPNYEDGYVFNTITAVDISGNLINSESFLMGNSNSIYVSEENLYITYQKNMEPYDYESIQKSRFFDVILPLLPKDTQDKIMKIQNDSLLDSRQKWRQVSEIIQDTYNSLSKEEKDKLLEEMSNAAQEYDSKFQNDVRRTIVHKIALDQGNLKYVANNDVSGYPLNQFSMDEHKGFFRIATTSESYSNYRTTLSNNVYVLDSELKVAGKLENIAPDERIYSARFMGDKLYLVTFRQMDPFFVIDLSSTTPKILGELKIPGFSNYLQPYDATHIIGIGYDTKENQWGGIEQKGIKISMFDVADFKNPKETDTVVIGSSGTYSDATDNHKALLLDKSKGIISIPIKTNVAALKPQAKIASDDYNKNWYGFYVFTVNKTGFSEKGTIPHYVWQNSYSNQYMSPRSLYIDNYLYTVMDGSIKINKIDNLDEINTIKLQQSGSIIPFVD